MPYFGSHSNGKTPPRPHSLGAVRRFFSKADPMDDEPKLSPFALNRGRVVLLILGALLVLIGISTAMGGLSSYQQLKDASTAARAAAETPAQ